MPCLASWSVVVAGSAPALLIFLCWALLTPTAIPAVSAILLFWALAATFIQCHFAMHAGMACLYLACWDNTSGFAHTFRNNFPGFPDLGLAVSDWHLFKGICCKLGHDCWLFIICTVLEC